MQIEEVIVKPLVTGCRGTTALIAVTKKAQRGEGPFDGVGPREPAALHRHRIAR